MTNNPSPTASTTRSGRSAARCRANFIRVREGDVVEFHLSNDPTEQDAAQHRPARGDRPGRRRGEASRRPGHQSQFTFKALNPGPLRLPLRHGAGGHAHRQRDVRADPGRAEGRLRRSIHEFYVMQGEFYTHGKTAKPGCRPSTCRRRSTRSPTTWSSTARWAR